MQQPDFKRLLRRLVSRARQQRSELVAALRPAFGSTACAKLLFALGPRVVLPRRRKHTRHSRHGVAPPACKVTTAMPAAAHCRPEPHFAGPASPSRTLARLFQCDARFAKRACVCASAKVVRVHRNTSFRWHWRFLEGLRRDPPKRLAGIAEANALFLLELQKGARRLERPAGRRGGVPRAEASPMSTIAFWSCAIMVARRVRSFNGMQRQLANSTRSIAI